MQLLIQKGSVVRFAPLPRRADEGPAKRDNGNLYLLLMQEL